MSHFQQKKHLCAHRFAVNLEGVGHGEDRFQHAKIQAALHKMSCNALPNSLLLEMHNNCRLLCSFPEALHPIHSDMT